MRLWLLITQIGNQQNYYLFMEGEIARDVTKDAASIKIAGLCGEQKVGFTLPLTTQ